MSFVLVLGLVSSARAGLLPLPWVGTDINTVTEPNPGSTDYNPSPESFAVTGAGHHIWYGNDIFHFVNQPSAGDIEITARLVSNVGAQPYRRAGVMIRQTLEGSSQMATIQIMPGPGLGNYTRRLTDGAAAVETNVFGFGEPTWLRLARVGDTFTGYTSPDGSAWTQLGPSTDITMTGPVYVGLSVCGTNGEYTTATFDNVTIIPEPATMFLFGLGSLALLRRRRA